MAINIILDDADVQNPIFVEIEDDSGTSKSVGTRYRKDGYLVIRITEGDL